MKITVWTKERLELEVLEDNGDYAKRKEWCEVKLANFFRSTGCGIKRIRYYRTALGELIRVLYSDSNDDCYKDCWISGDSYAAVVEDMYRQHVVY